MSTFADRLLVVAATDREAAPFRAVGLATIVTGVGRVNAAIATTLAIAGRPEPPVIIAVGIAGSLPGGASAAMGALVIGTRSVYAEEGILTPQGFQTIEEMGFPLAGYVVGNGIKSEPTLLERLLKMDPSAIRGPIATVATCSGTDEQAREIAARTGGIAEAMEGAAVLHAAKAIGASAIEVRVISNTTGDRSRQVWDLPKAFDRLAVFARTLSQG
ncbi:MAG: futalosine hydrolase [Phycisphaerae bacterium]|nr:futalosine hydrolase [Phycisphaerae bacterium]